MRLAYYISLSKSLLIRLFRVQASECPFRLKACRKHSQLQWEAKFFTRCWDTNRRMLTPPPQKKTNPTVAQSSPTQCPLMCFLEPPCFFPIPKAHPSLKKEGFPKTGSRFWKQLPPSQKDVLTLDLLLSLPMFCNWPHPHHSSRACGKTYDLSSKFQKLPTVTTRLGTPALVTQLLLA